MAWGDSLPLSFAISVDELPTVDVVHVAGELDLSTSPELKKALSTLSSRPSTTRGVVFDFREVSFLDSTTLSVLVEEVRRRPGARFSVVLPNAELRRVFEITGLDRYLELSVSAEPATA